MQVKIGLKGYGNYGKPIRNLLRRFGDEQEIDIDVLVQDPMFEPDGRKFFELKDLRDCHAMVFAVDMEFFETAVKEVLAIEGLREDMIFVNVCSDQVRSGETLAALAGKHPIICLHSPWGREAYAYVNGVVSMLPAIVVTKFELPVSIGEPLLEIVKKCGFAFRTDSAEEHDTKLAGRWMFFAHFICQLAERLKIYDDKGLESAPLSVQLIIRGARMLRGDRRLFLGLWNRVPECHRTFEKILGAVHTLEIEKRIHGGGK